MNKGSPNPVGIKQAVSKETGGLLALCEQLSRLDEKWETLLGDKNSAIAKECRPGRCKFLDSEIEIVLYVSNAAALKGLKFKEKFIKSKVEAFLGYPIKITFERGKAEKRSSYAYGTGSAPKRRAPVLISSDCLKKERNELFNFVKDEALATTIARIKIMSEKLAKRKQIE